MTTVASTGSSTQTRRTRGRETFDPFPDDTVTYDTETLWPFFKDRAAATLGVLLGDKHRSLPLVELEGDGDTDSGTLQQSFLHPTSPHPVTSGRSLPPA